MKIAALCLVLLSGVVHAAEKTSSANGLEIRFKTEREGTVMVNVYRADGTLVRRLVPGDRFSKGAHMVEWDGKGDDGKMAEAGEYTWKGLYHEGIGLKLRGWVANGGGLPWVTPDGKGGWGGDRGVPSAVAADDKKVYLGWSLADEGKSVLACDLEGRVQWSHRRSEGASGCKALAVDDGLVYVLGGLEGTGADGGTIYRLNANDGTPVPWPSGAIDLKISSFWPADGKAKPDTADAMAVRHGHIYLCFTGSQFLTVLDAKTGDYLQTVVGAPPGMIDVAPTKTELPDAPGKVADADFGLISLGGGVLGRILFAHDPFWVIMSDMTPTERDETITALTVVGDGAKFHMHTAFVGFGAPIHQVQARPLLDTENPTWIAGRKGGRPLLGPWQADDLHAIHGVALAADGKLWVAEGDASPKRFSVWDTTGKKGKVVREFFGPAERGAPGGAINPLDPDVMFAQGCEWRADRKTGAARCLGVITREETKFARYGIGGNGHAYLLIQQFGGEEQFTSPGPLSIYERVRDGDYRLRGRVFYGDKNGSELLLGEEKMRTVIWSDENGDGQIQKNELRSYPQVLVLNTPAMTGDLTLQMRLQEDHSRYWLLRVKEWTACGAPIFELSTPGNMLGRTGTVSADGKMMLSTIASGNESILLCCHVVDGREKWKLLLHDVLSSDDDSLPSARLAAPIGNVWLIAMMNAMAWHLVSEDGFDMAQFFESDPQKAHFPNEISRGVDMTHATKPPAPL